MTKTMITRTLLLSAMLLLGMGCQTTQGRDALDETSGINAVQISNSHISKSRGRYEELGTNPLPHSKPPSAPGVIKNFRVVIPGILYRGGVSGRRGFSESELKALCREGFSQAVYFYDKGFKANSVNCKNKWGEDNSLVYVHYKTQNRYYGAGKSGLGDLLTDINQAASAGKGPIYIHCHNGWHATGIASAVAARQFCGMDSAKAIKYMKHTTDGSYDTIKKWAPGKVKRYQMQGGLTWDRSSREALCKELLKAGSSL